MFGNYKLGDISKGLYNKATNVTSNASTSKVPSKSSSKTETETTAADSKLSKGYRFGDLRKSVYKTVGGAYSNYQLGSLTKSAFHTLTSQYEPFKVRPNKVAKEGWLYKKNDKLLTYRTFWCVLDAHHQCLFLCDGAKQYDRCVQIMELRAFQKVQSVTRFGGYQHQFDVVSASDRRTRFSAPSKMERAEWIQSLIQSFKAQELSDLQEEMVGSNSGHGLDMQYIAFYIIDLEFYRSETGEAQQMLQNQNFLIACLIWSYIHQKTDQDKQLRDSLKEQAWLHPAAIEAESAATGVVTGAGTAVARGVTGGYWGALIAAVVVEERIKRSNAPHSKKLVQQPLVPLAAMAGFVVAVPVAAGWGAVTGYQQGYAKVQHKHGNDRY